MQGNDLVQSVMYTRGVTCFSCHDPHGSPNQAMLRKPADQICQSCHVPGGTNGPSEVSIEAHTHHPANSVASQCISCHMPKIEVEIPGVNVAAHTFHFITPSDTELLKVPNACNGCHKDKDTAWAKTQLASWNTRSPWRVSN